MTKPNKAVWTLRESDVRDITQGMNLTKDEFQRVCRDIEFPEWGEEVREAANYVLACRKDKR